MLTTKCVSAVNLLFLLLPRNKPRIRNRIFFQYRSHKIIKNEYISVYLFIERDTPKSYKSYRTTPLRTQVEVSTTKTVHIFGQLTVCSNIVIIIVIIVLNNIFTDPDTNRQYLGSHDTQSKYLKQTYVQFTGLPTSECKQ